MFTLRLFHLKATAEALSLKCIRPNSSSTWSSSHVRSTFINFFQNDDHLFVPSSSVIPSKGEGTYFTNAGIDQFKPIILGTVDPSSEMAIYKQVVNSQKCIRVSGKYDDLDNVGKDLTHHTFFEMLGNWSFGHYFKEQACHKAFTLLTSVYQLPLDRLYFTYFEGDLKLNLSPDIECKDIWKSLGIPEDRILPFGMKDNFWGMGDTGPCGPCTEIHYDHGGAALRSELVNTGSPEVVEIWNLVFMQYNGQADGSLAMLPNYHVDTGMGLERMVAVLNGSHSNYDSDLFRPLFEVIQKASSAPAYMGRIGDADLDGLDTAYRTLADHARMFTVAISDGLVPDNRGLRYKLQHIINRCIRISQKNFNTDPKLLCSLVDCIAESLGEPFPDILVYKGKTKDVVALATEHYLELQQQARQSFKKMLQKSKRQHLTGDLMWELHEGQYGCCIPQDLLLELADEFRVSVDYPGFEHLQQKKDCSDGNGQKECRTCSVVTCTASKGANPWLCFAKVLKKGVDDKWRAKLLHCINRYYLRFNPNTAYKSTNSAPVKEFVSHQWFKHLQETGEPFTDDAFKYAYWKSDTGYDSSEVNCMVVGLFHGDKIISATQEGTPACVILDKTCFYAEAGGQVADTGVLLSDNGEFEVYDVQEYHGYILHYGQQRKGSFAVGDHVQPVLQEGDRFECMRKHTATHLLQAAVRNYLGPQATQQGSSIRPDHLTFDFICMEPLTSDRVKQIENAVLTEIRAGHPVSRTLMSLEAALESGDILILPGEVYSPEVILVHIGDQDKAVSRELCCGTHVLNTSDIEDFCITCVSNVSQGIKQVQAVTGTDAIQAHLAGEQLMKLCEELSSVIKTESQSVSKIDDLSASLHQVHLAGEERIRLNEEVSAAITTQSEAAARMQELSTHIQQMTQMDLLPHTAREHASSLVEMVAQNITPAARQEKQVTLREIVEDLLLSDREANFLLHSMKFEGKQVLKALSTLETSRPVALVSHDKAESAITIVWPKGQSPGISEAELQYILGNENPVRIKKSVNKSGHNIVLATVKGKDLGDRLAERVKRIMTIMTR